MRPLAPVDLAEIQMGVGDAWKDLAGAHLLLTGCTGFFGPWLLESLLAANKELGLNLHAWVLTRDPEGFYRRLPHLAQHPALILMKGDVRTFSARNVPFTHLVHGAASSNAQPGPQAPETIVETIVDGTRRVLFMASQVGLKRALFISSGAVYGDQPPSLERMTEDQPWAPTESPYALAKRQAEALCLASTVPVVVARAFAFLGPHLPLNAHFAAGNFLGDTLAERPIHIHGDGRPIRSYLYGTDLAVWLWTMLLRGTPGRPYNLGSEKALTIAQLAGAVAEARGSAVIIDEGFTSSPAPRYVPCTDRAQTELGLRQTVALPEAIRRTLAWHTLSSENS